MPVLPFKLNQARRHHIPRQQHKVTNWPAYEAGLRQRGSLTVWLTDGAVAAWAAEPRTTRGGQPFYSPLAILTALTLRAVFRLAYRQAEGLIGSIISLLGPMLRVATMNKIEQLVKLLNREPPLKYSEIEEINGIPKGTIGRVAVELQKEGKVTPRYEPLLLSTIKANRAIGATWSEIARAEGCSRQAVHDFVKRHAPEMLR
jgi:hypothetical protein